VRAAGFPVRIPMDMRLVFSANPVASTTRGNIITPLRDRIASQIMTHYPLTVDDGIAITAQESWTVRDSGIEVVVTRPLRELIEQVAIEARKSEYVDQSSGVSARMTISLLENVVSNAERRGLRTGEKQVWPRLADLHGAIAAISGKVELVYAGEPAGPTNFAPHLVGRAVKSLSDPDFPDACQTRWSAHDPPGAPPLATITMRFPGTTERTVT